MREVSALLKTWGLSRDQPFTVCHMQKVYRGESNVKSRRMIEAENGHPGKVWKVTKEAFDKLEPVGAKKQEGKNRVKTII